HRFYCKEHKTSWCAGSNLFSSWRYQTEAEQRAIWDEIGLNDFEDVKPYIPPECTSFAADTNETPRELPTLKTGEARSGAHRSPCRAPRQCRRRSSSRSGGRTAAPKRSACPCRPMLAAISSTSAHGTQQMADCSQARVSPSEMRRLPP